MKWQQLIGDIYTEISKELERALDGLTVDDLNQQPDSDCNSIGWLAWHLTRAQDATNEYLTGEGQLWVKDKWHNRFDRALGPVDTRWGDIGMGHSSEDVAAFRSPDSGTLMEYHRAVLEKTLHYLNNKLTEADLEQKYKGTTKVCRLLVTIISDNLQHVGQVAYLRGLLKGKGWSDI